MESMPMLDIMTAFRCSLVNRIELALSRQLLVRNSSKSKRRILTIEMVCSLGVVLLTRNIKNYTFYQFVCRDFNIHFTYEGMQETPEPAVGSRKTRCKLACHQKFHPIRSPHWTILECGGLPGFSARRPHLSPSMHDWSGGDDAKFSKRSTVSKEKCGLSRMVPTVNFGDLQ